jgi:hypothetical protein
LCKSEIKYSVVFVPSPLCYANSRSAAKLESPNLSWLRRSQPPSIQLQKGLVSRKTGINVMNAVNLVPIRRCKGTPNKETRTMSLISSRCLDSLPISTSSSFSFKDYTFMPVLI